MISGLKIFFDFCHLLWEENLPYFWSVFPMLKTQFTLIAKRDLTHDVYELTYSCPDLVREPPQPWQYVMFQLAPGLNRSYSIASFTPDSFTLVIKRVAEGKGSSIICDAEIGQVFSGMLPLGHFVLRDTPVSKCFIGTGTGFAPLYCQMLECRWLLSRVAFIFGVRNLIDSFYWPEIASLWEQIADFRYIPYLSREESPGYAHGYVIDWITAENIAEYGEFYLCGSPAMVRWAREKLEALGVETERVFWEQF